MNSENAKLQTFDSFCQNQPSLKTKIALLTFYKVKFPAWIEALILTFEYLQLISQSILTSSFAYDDPKHNESFPNFIFYLLKLVTPSYLLIEESSDSIKSAILILLICGTFIKLLLFANAIYVSIMKRNMNSWLLLVWRWIYKLQTRLLYFLFTSFWVHAIVEAQDRGFRLYGMSEASLMFVGVLMLTIEFAFTLTLETQFGYFLPTKSFLASKNNRLQLATFLQKFVFQVCLLILHSETEALAWVSCSLSIIFGITRFRQLFCTLPLYHLKALLLQGGLMSTVISAGLAHFFNNILQASDYEAASINFVIITWILLALLMNKASYNALKSQILISLTGRNTKKGDCPEILIHKVFATKELKQSEKAPTCNSSNYSFRYILSLQQNLNIVEIFGLETREVLPAKEEYLFDSLTMKKVYLMYFQELLKKYPKNSLIKLHVALQSFKNGELFTKAIQILTEIQKKKWSQDYLSSSLLLHDIEEAILATHTRNETDLDFYKYIKSRMLLEELQNHMLKQTDLSLKVCNNILNETSNIGEIHSSAQEISHLKRIIQKKIDSLSHQLPEYCISPFLCYAEYHLVANHSVINFEKYHEIYTQKYYRAMKFTKEPVLLEENLYQDSNGFLLVSSQKSQQGKILFCNKSLVNLCGGSGKKTYQDSYISTLFSPSLRAYYDKLFKQSEIMTGIKQEFLNNIHRTYLYNKDGYLVEADFCLKFHPYLVQGLCLDMIIRSIPGNSEFLLLKENGEIEGASQGLSRALCLQSITTAAANNTISVRELSEQLFLVNSAFNRYILKDEKVIERTCDGGNHLFYEKAAEIYLAFTSEDQEVQLYPYQKNLEALTFYCKVQVLHFGNIKMKLVSLRVPGRGYDLNSPTPMVGAVDKEEDFIEYENFDCEEKVKEDYLPPTSRENVQSSLPTSPRLTQGDQPLLTTERGHLIAETIASKNLNRKSLLMDTPKIKSHQQRGSVLFSESDKNELENYNVGEIRGYASSTGSQTRSVEKVENKAFRKAILTKSYPKSFTILCLIFYLVILMTFAGQIIMKSVSDSTMKGLQVRKNLLKYSEHRNYKGALIQINTLGCSLQIEGLLVLAGILYGPAAVIINLQVRLADMKLANDKMLGDIYSLDEKTQKLLFAADVRMNGTYLDSADESTYKYVNTFQVTQETTSIIKAMLSLANATGVEAYNMFKYPGTNLQSDFLYKREISDILANSVQEQKESFENITNAFLILSPFLLVGIGILLSLIIWNQYRIEKRNMKAFIKIPTAGVKTIAERLSQFKKKLVSQESFEKSWEGTSGHNSIKFQESEQTASYSKRAHDHKIIYNKFRARYYKYITKVFVCISILVAITIWDLIATQRAIKVIYNRQNQLQFANYISNRATLSHLAYFNLFFTNNELITEHRTPLDSLVQAAKDMRTIQTEIPKKFLEVDGTYDPEVRRIIFENNLTCQGFQTAYSVYCKALLSAGIPVNMIVVASALQDLLAIKIKNYQDADKASIKKVIEAAYWSPSTLQYFVTIAEEAQMIGEIMDKSMTSKIEETEELRNTIIVIFSIGLLLVSLFVWFYIFRVIREVYNEFKKVLQVLPPNLVLSSYLLKRFLQETSHGPLFG